MTLLDIANYACEITGLTDEASVAQAKRFCRARWRMVWDSANWRQGRVELLGTVPAGSEEVALPEGVQLVLAVRANGRELPPGDDLAALRVDAGGYAEAGRMVAFSPGPRDAGGRATIRLHRPPDAGTELLIVCKRVCPPLEADGDAPAIPGAAQALCDYTTADMLKWVRQYARAGQWLQEGGVHLQKMVELETAQAGVVARFIPGEW
jgi:hypothetical protein